ncbi:hypothetical protein GF373_11315 [bacterium]|nr:hypothetical protein [bacterium]
MAKSQLIDIYQKGLSKKDEERERYEPNGHNKFEKDALIIREFWNQLIDYPNLDFQGDISKGPGQVQMVLSSPKEAVVYLSSKPGVEKKRFPAQSIQLESLKLKDGEYTYELWKPSSPGGILKNGSCKTNDSKVKIELPDFVDDILIHLHTEKNNN